MDQAEPYLTTAIRGQPSLKTEPIRPFPGSLTNFATGPAADGFAVVGPTGRHRPEGTGDLIEQGTNLGAVIDVLGRQRHREELARIGIHTNVHLAPG